MYTVALLNFEGPLDLLLQLIERSDVEITEISLSDITAQYLDYLHKLPNLGPTELNQFLELASRLIYLKSVALLPISQNPQLEVAMADLTEQLAGYQKYQSAALYLERLIQGGQQTWTRQITAQLSPSKLPLPNVSLESLQATFNKAISSLPQTYAQPPSAKTITLAQMNLRLTSWLSHQTKNATLSSFLAELTNQSELIVAFMTLLELIKQQLVTVSQNDGFGDILISRNEVRSTAKTITPVLRASYSVLRERRQR